jgi:hypothetical protein
MLRLAKKRVGTSGEFLKEDRYWAQLKDDLVTLKNDRQLNL